MTSFEEKRLTLRVPVAFRVKVETARGTLQGTGRDLSEGGVSVFLPSSPPPGSAVDVIFHLPGGAQPLRVTGEITHLERKPGAANWVGIRFVRMDLGSQQAIRQFVRAAAEKLSAVPPPLPRR